VNRFLSSIKGFLGIPEEEAVAPEAARCVFLPVPYEHSSSYGRGSCRGPEAIIEASKQVEFFDATLGFEPRARCGGLATFEPLAVDSMDATAVEKALFGEVLAWLNRDKFILALGGEHTSVVGAIHAHAKYYDEVTVLQLDAHSDLRESYEDNPWSHACAMARVLDFHDRLVQVGIRSQCIEERQRSEALAIPVFYGEAIQARAQAGEDWIGDIVRATTKRVYITLDCDVFEPYWMPATGTPEPGGLSWMQINALLQRLCAEREVAGLDVNELSPLPDVHYPQYLIAKLIYRFLGYRFGG